MNIVHDPVDPTSIADNDINTFIEDRSGHIWIGTAGNGVSFYSFYKPKFSHWQYDQDNEIPTEFLVGTPEVEEPHAIRA